jgi:hypothetical protein
MLSVSGEIPVIAAPVVTSLTIGGVTPSGDETMLFEGTSDNVLDVTVYDQYGQEMALTDGMFYDEIPEPYGALIQVLSSNDDAIPTTSWDIIDGEFTFDTNNDGMAMITLVIPNQAFLAQSDVITVYPEAVLTSITTAGPDEALYAMEATDFPVLGYDQYGNVVDVSGTGVTFTQTVDLFDDGGVYPNVEATNEFGFTASTDGTSTVYYFLNGMFQGTFDVIVNPEAYPFQITAVAAPGGMEECTVDRIMSDDITVIDQYGRTMSDPFGSGMYDFNLMTAAATDLFWVNWMGSGDGFDVNAQCGKDTGSASFKAVLIKSGQTMTESAFLFDIMYVETEDVDGFAMTAISGPMYTEDVFEFGQSAENYHKTVKVTGKYGELDVLLYDDNADGLPDLIDVITTSVDQVEVMTDNILAPNLELTGATGTMTVKAWRNGEPVAMTDVELSNVAPDCVSITPVADGDGTDSSDSFTFKDQYGVGLVYDLLEASRSGDDPNWYFYGTEWTDADYYYLNLVKWDGSISATYMETLD